MRPCVVLLLFLLGSAGAVRAAGPLGVDGAPITTSKYRIDLFQGPVLASGRVTAIGGAYTALAEGIDGFGSNAAAPAVRPPWSADWLDYAVSAGLTAPASVANTDFDNDGARGFTYGEFLFVTLGLQLQLGQVGLGVGLDIQNFSLGTDDELEQGLPQLSVSVVRLTPLLARSFSEGQLVAGVGLRTAQLTLTGDLPGDSSTTYFTTSSLGLQGGVVVAPNSWPLRLGLTVRAPMSPDTEDDEGTVAPNPDGDIVVGRRYLPLSIEVPWEIEAGASFRLGPRPLNIAWKNPRYDDAVKDLPSDERHRIQHARYRALARQHLTVSASVLVSGPVKNAVGLEGFLAQRVQRSGQSLSFTPRLGAEAEPFDDRLLVRAGSYLEPSRFGAGPRIHLTTGVEVKLFESSVLGLYDEDTGWRVGAFVDAAPRYFSWGVTGGVWH